MKERKSVTLFLIITFALSAVIDFVWIVGGEAATVRGISALLMWCPAIAAFIVRRIYYRKEKLLGWNKCKFSYILTAIGIPALYLGVSYSIYWLLNKGSFTGILIFPASAALGNSDKASSSPVLVTLITWFAMIVSSIIAATGEEIGWRGFLLPQLIKIWNLKKAIIVSGLIWAVWHFPIMLAGLYNAGTPIWYQLPVFVIEILAFTVIISILRIKSNSVWPAIIIHAFHNNIDQVILGPMTVSANKVYFVGETGVVTIIATIVVAVGVVKFFIKKESTKIAGDMSQTTT